MKKLATGIAAGLAHLTRKRIVHMDLAARNILLQPMNNQNDPYTPKITDFGMSTRVARSGSKIPASRKLLPLRSLPPEAVLERVINTKTDVWSYGVLLWEMYSFGETPYVSLGLPIAKIPSWVKEGNRLKQPSSCPDPMYKLMCDCWELEPEDRPSFTQIHKRLNKMEPHAPPHLEGEESSSVSGESEDEKNSNDSYVVNEGEYGEDVTSEPVYVDEGAEGYGEALNERDAAPLDPFLMSMPTADDVYGDANQDYGEDVN